MKLGTLTASAATVTALLTLSSCTEPQKIRDLGRCWNVNTIPPGPVRGEGVFINASPHGYALQAPDCDDRAGNNAYKLSKLADEQLRSAQIAKLGQYSGFIFDGVVQGSPAGRVLVIKRFERFHKVRQPEWIARIYEKAGLPAD